MNRRDLIKAMVSAACVSGAGPARAAGPDYGASGADLRPGAPADEGFYFPAEWVRHERTLMQFLPAQYWNHGYLEGARVEWAAVANAISAFEPVTMAVRPEDSAVARKLLTEKVELLELPLDEGWSRDSGPMVLVDGRGGRRVAGFEFNGWGRKMWPCRDDALVKARFAKHYGLPFHPAPLVLEGGAVTLDGDGTCLTTEECLLNDNRNPGLGKAGVEQVLKGWLGVDKVLWLGRGIVPDEITDGHVDGIAAFAAPGRVLLHTIDDRGDPNWEITQDAKQRLQAMTDAKGRKIEVIELPLGLDVAHMNFYICNGAILVPTADDPRQDDAPLAILREVFPGREVIPLSGRHIAEGGGGIHCITQQLPEA